MGWDVNLSTDGLPNRYPVEPIHYLLGFATAALHMGMLITPPTSSWLLFRRAVAFPLILVCYCWVTYVPIHPHPEDQWGVVALLLACIMRLIDHTFFTPEHTVYRTTPTATTQNSKQVINLVREDIPPPWTLAKYFWAFSLYFSWRGIGWSFTSPISAKGLNPPFTPTSPRWSFVKHQLPFIPVIFLVGDCTKTYMRYHAYRFFSGTTSYSALSFREAIGIHLAVVARVWWILNNVYIPLSIVAVLLGGWLGREGEFWSPWGWPPIFGGLKEIWVYPGLSTVWSRFWNNGGRRWFEQIGWVGIGEKILRLPRSNISRHPYVPIHRTEATMESVSSSGAVTPSPTLSGLTPITSRSVSPSHPLPTAPSSRIPTWRIALSNLIKSLIVFTLSGLLHDLPAILLRLNDRPSGASSLRLEIPDIIYVTPFFSVQPIALVVEAVIKRSYRRFKLRQGIQRGTESSRLVFIERAISFLIVWTWLFWCSAWYVSGVGRMRLYVWEGDGHFSLIEGVLWGKWWI